MKFLLELDGVLIDLGPLHWQAYGEAAGELKLPRVDRAAFWRMVRTGAAAGQHVRGATPAKLRAYQQQLVQAFESDGVWTGAQPHDDADEFILKLKRHGPCALFTTGRNRKGRQAAVDAHGISRHFLEMAAVGGNVDSASARLAELARENPPAVAVTATVTGVRVASAADVFTIGVSTGDATLERLRHAGAHVAYKTLADVTQELDTGAQQLTRLGLPRIFA